MLTIEELNILREALEMYALKKNEDFMKEYGGILNREFSTQLQEIERKLNTMMQSQGSG